MRADPPPESAPAGVYLHFPFCAIRCSYCDFPTVAGQDERIEAYLAALETEIRRFQQELPRAVDSVFLGGGTPSRMTPQQVSRLLRVVAERFDVAVDCEVTLEANPESLTPASLAGYRDAGITRVSVGVQSLDDRVLARVGRAHDGSRAAEAIAEARAAGLLSVNLDLIAGLPGENLEAWERTVRRAASLGPDHLSVYLLESDKETPLGRSIRHGRTRVADDDRLAAAYEATVATLEQLGFEQYEISNFARFGHRSRHNLKYWTDVAYAGFGLGAHAYHRGARRANRRDLDGYLDDLSSGHDPLCWRDPWDPRRRLEEALILGLRRVEGIDLAQLGARYEADVLGDYLEAWDRAAAAGLLVWFGDTVRLTAWGRLRSNELFADLISSAAA